jgi:electron transfer flavoprotein beta subunit
VSYHCVVCAKQVPDTTNITGAAMKPDGTVNRAAQPAIFNPEDLCALEQALRIRDRHGGSVTVVTMGLPKACDILRDALGYGADRAVLLTDRRAAGSDTLATSYILARVVDRLGADIVLCGRQAIDGDTAQVGPQIAEKLGLTLITYLEELIDLRDRAIRVRRNIGTGWQTVEAALPVLVTVMDRAGDIRPAHARRRLKFRKAMCPAEIERAVAADLRDAADEERSSEVEKRKVALADHGLLIEQWSLDDIEADPQWCGLDGSPTKVHRVQSLVLAGGDYREFAPTRRGVHALVSELIDDHTIG